MVAQQSQLANAEGMEKQSLDKRLESMAWALFLIMAGGLGLVPNEQVPQGAWLIGVGLIMISVFGPAHFERIGALTRGASR